MIDLANGVRVRISSPVPRVRASSPVTRLTVLPVAGPTGPAGSAVSSYRHVQSTPASDWIINHNLGRHPVISFVLTGSNRQVFTDVVYQDDNTALAEFDIPVTGIADM